MAEQGPIVTIKTGQLRGQFESERGGRTAVFKGIPYARAPVGPLRWRPPEPPEPWTGVRPATDYGPRAWQRTTEFSVFFNGILEMQGFSWLKQQLFKLMVRLIPPPPQDEDCLQLNVRTPDLEGKLPVMVWIHGGAHQSGSARDIFYQSNALAHEGVVLVTINYRLGLMGYLAHPELSAESPHDVSGNYGTLDQIMALRWVRENIAAFGGDPEQVTIFGESAGGESVLHMMISPLARGLFHRVIAQSPATGAQLVHLRRDVHVHEAAERSGRRFAEVAGAADIASLRAMPAAELQAIVNANSHELGTFHPIIDGYVLPKSLFQAFRDGEQAQVPFLLGSNADEATLFFPLFQTPLPEYHSQTVQDGLMPAFMREEFGDDMERLFALYPGLTALEREAITAMQGDVIFGAPARWYAEAAAANGQPTFLYFFKRVPPSSRQIGGAFHASELVFVHGSETPFIETTAAEEPLGRAMRGYWTQFAKNGDPNGYRDNAIWEPFDAREPRWLELDVAEQVMRPVAREAKYQILLRRLERLLARVEATERQPAD